MGMGSPGSRDVNHRCLPQAGNRTGLDWTWIKLCPLQMAAVAPCGGSPKLLTRTRTPARHRTVVLETRRMEQAVWQRCGPRRLVRIDSCPSAARCPLPAASCPLPAAATGQRSRRGEDIGRPKDATATMQNKEEAAKNRGYGRNATTCESSCHGWVYDRPKSMRQAVIYFRDNGV